MQIEQILEIAMLKILAIAGTIFFTNIFAAETSIAGMNADDLITLRGQIYQVTMVAGKAAILAKCVMNGGSVEECSGNLTKEFKVIETLMSAAHPLIVQRSIATKKEAEIAHAYYLGVKENLFAVTIAMAFEAMAEQANYAGIDDEKREPLNDRLAKVFRVVQGELGAGPAIELRSITTKEEATAACIYYRGVRDNLLARIQAMAKDEHS